MEIEIKNKDRYQNSLTSYVNRLKERSNPEKLEELSKMRDISIETLEQADIFYIGSMVEMLLPDYLDVIGNLGVISETNKKPIFNERWVIPIKDINGKVQNLVGYSNKADERYIYGNSRYYRRRDTLYGLENLAMAYELGYAVLTEGITDTLRLRSMGILNSFANCGTHKSDWSIQLLNRCRYGVIKIPDRDSAGKKAEKQWNFYKSITIHTDIRYKDCDEMLRGNAENQKLFMDVFNPCVSKITSIEHKGMNCGNETITIV